jgi:hypothetical protein
LRQTLPVAGKWASWYRYGEAQSHVTYLRLYGIRFIVEFLRVIAWHLTLLFSLKNKKILPVLLFVMNIQDIVFDGIADSIPKNILNGYLF